MPPRVLDPPRPRHQLRRRNRVRLRAAGAAAERRARQSLARSAAAGRRVSDPLHPRRLQLRRRHRRGPHLRQPDAPSPGRLARRVPRRRQADPRHLQRLSGADQERPARQRRRGRAGRHAHLERLGQVHGPLGPPAHAAATTACSSPASSGCICRSPTPRASSAPATRRRSTGSSTAASSCCATHADSGAARRAIPTAPSATSPASATRRGRVFGLMPHPERFIDPTQHPQWTRRPPRAEGDGLPLFRNAVRYFV